MGRDCGVVPRIAVVREPRCFAGNAVIAGCSDLIVATRHTSIGMGGPAMIAGGGLGGSPRRRPPSPSRNNGVVDVVVADGGRGRSSSLKLLGYFRAAQLPGNRTKPGCVIPERARRAQLTRPVIETADTDSVTFPARAVRTRW